MSRPLNADDVYRAVAHPVRRRIIDLLRQRDRPVADLASTFRITRASLSRHLNVLRESRLVGQRRNGQGRTYFLRPHALRRVAEWAARAEA